jgi:hypothetical protein
MTDGLTDELTNTQYAPLAALSVHYQQNLTLKPLAGVQIPVKTRDFSPYDKLVQVLFSVLAGCETLSEVNVRLKPEINLARLWQWNRFADQSCLSRTLDALTLKQIAQLRGATAHIWRSHSLTIQHDWRGYLWLDFDLSGLPCGKQAEESQKGYFSGKKTSLDANWHVSAPSDTVRLSGLICTQAINILFIASSQQCSRPKML